MSKLEIHNISVLNLKTHDLTRDGLFLICEKCNMIFGMYHTDYRFDKRKEVTVEHFSSGFDLSCDEMLIKNIIE